MQKDVKLYLLDMYETEQGYGTTLNIKFIREELLKEKNLEYLVCKRCGRSSFKDFKICIYCNVGMEGRNVCISTLKRESVNH